VVLTLAQMLKVVTSTPFNVTIVT